MKEIISGIYCIENKINGKKYIGQTKNFLQRIGSHKSDLNRHKVRNKHLQDAWDKYGEENFKFYLLQECPKEQLDILEMEIIDEFNTMDRDFGYNILSGGNVPPNFLGKKHSDATKLKMSKASKGNKHWLGKKHTEETKLKQSNAGKGKKKSLETCKKISDAKKGKNAGINNFWYGKQMFAEVREKLRIANIGRKHTIEEDERRAKSLQGKNKNSNHKYIGVRQEKRNINETWVANIGGKHLGSFISEEEAARHYDQWALKLYGDDAKLNFEDSRIHRFEVLENKKKRKTFKSTSIYSGVNKTKNGKYRCSLKINKKTITIGTFKDEIDAAKAYDKYIVENNINRELNFPEDYK